MNKDLVLPEILPHKPNVSIVGGFQNGKSTLVNCLLGDFVARLGTGLVTTKQIITYRFGEVDKIVGYDSSNNASEFTFHEFLRNENHEIVRFDISLWKPILNSINLIDTPGFDANDADTSTLEASLQNTSYAIFITTNQREIKKSEIALFEILSDYRIPFAVIMNCVDQYRWNPNHEENANLAKENASKIKNMGYHSDSIIQGQNVHISNFAWFFYASGIFNKQKKWEKETGIKANTEDILPFLQRIDVSSDNNILIEASNVIPIRHFLRGTNRVNASTDYVKWKSWLREILRGQSDFFRLNIRTNKEKYMSKNVITKTGGLFTGPETTIVPDFDDLAKKADKISVESIERRLDSEIEIAKSKADKANQAAKNAQDTSNGLVLRLLDMEKMIEEKVEKTKLELADVVRQKINSDEFVQKYEELIKSHLSEIDEVFEQKIDLLAIQHEGFQQIQKEIRGLIEEFQAIYETRQNHQKDLETNIVVNFLNTLQSLSLTQRLEWVLLGKLPPSVLKSDK